MKRYFPTISKNIAGTSGLNKSPSKLLENNLNRNLPKDLDIDSSSDSCSSVENLEVPQRKKYNQKYKPEWELTFSWLRKVDEKAFCNVCFKVLANNKCHLARHEKNSKSHARNINVKNVIPTLQQWYSSAEQFSETYKKRAAEFSCVMYCIQYDLPFQQMESLPIFIQRTCNDSQVAKKIKCGKTKATEIVNKIIGPYSITKISGKLKNTLFSLMIDETTDVSTAKCLVVVARFFDIKENCISDCFLGFLELIGSNAQDIFNALTNCFVESQIPIKNVVALAVDNASVMTGHLNGVVSKFLNINKDLFFLRCTCHSLHLSASAACKKIPNKIEKNIRNIFNHFAHSPKRQGSFKEFQEYFNIKTHKILKLSATRWLSYESVVNRILEQIEALKYYFGLYNYEELHTTNAAEIYNFIIDPLNKLYLLFMSYVLKLISNINKIFQSEKTQIHILHFQIETLLIEILKNFIKPEFLNSNMNSRNTELHLDLSSMHFGIHFEEFLNSQTFDEGEIKTLKMTLVDFYMELCDQIKQRFDLEDNKLKLLQYLNVKEICSGSLTSILPLLKCFPFSNCDVEILNNEFRRLIGNIEIANKYSGDVVEFWVQLKSYKNILNEPIFAEISCYMLKLCALPHSTAAAERKFSRLSLIKTNLRNSLNIKTVENVMFAKELLTKNKPCWEPSDSAGLLKFADKFNFTDGAYNLKN